MKNRSTLMHPGGRIINAVGTIFGKIFIGTRAHALSNSVELATSFPTQVCPIVSDVAPCSTPGVQKGAGTRRRSVTTAVATAAPTRTGAPSTAARLPDCSGGSGRARWRTRTARRTTWRPTTTPRDTTTTCPRYMTCPRYVACLRYVTCPRYVTYLRYDDIVAYATISRFNSGEDRLANRGSIAVHR